MGYLSYELDSDEELIETVRKHWTIFTLPFFRVMFVAMFMFTFFKFFQRIPYGMEFLFVLILASILYLVYEFWMWSLDLYLITDKKIVDIDQKGILKRVVAEAKFESIEEAVYEVNGFWGSVFKFGTIKIRLASGDMIVMEKIGHPEEITKIIKSKN